MGRNPIFVGRKGEIGEEQRSLAGFYRPGELCPSLTVVTPGGSCQAVVGRAAANHNRLGGIQVVLRHEGNHLAAARNGEVFGYGIGGETLGTRIAVVFVDAIVQDDTQHARLPRTYQRVETLARRGPVRTIFRAIEHSALVQQIEGVVGRLSRLHIGCKGTQRLRGPLAGIGVVGRIYGTGRVGLDKRIGFPLKVDRLLCRHGSTFATRQRLHPEGGVPVERVGIHLVHVDLQRIPLLGHPVLGGYHQRHLRGKVNRVGGVGQVVDGIAGSRTSVVHHNTGPRHVVERNVGNQGRHVGTYRQGVGIENLPPVQVDGEEYGIEIGQYRVVGGQRETGDPHTLRDGISYILVIVRVARNAR